MYIWTIEQKWNLTINPRILPTFDNSEANSNIFYQKYLQSNVGVDYGGGFCFCQMLLIWMHCFFAILVIAFPRRKFPFFKENVCKRDRIFCILLIAGLTQQPATARVDCDRKSALNFKFYCVLSCFK